MCCFKISVLIFLGFSGINFIQTFKPQRDRAAVPAATCAGKE
jgi:hypothetical protein